jgi:hypothetical protein
MPRYAIVEAPSALGHVPEHLGVERAPEVLLAAGLADGLAARRAGRVEAVGYRADRDAGTHVMNPQAIRDYSPLLADAVSAVLGEGEFPVVLGGDCSARCWRCVVAAVTGCCTSTATPTSTSRRSIRSTARRRRATSRSRPATALTSSPTSKAGGRWYGLGMWWCSPAVTLLTGNAGVASRCRQACWSSTVTRSAGPAPVGPPTRR